MPKFRFKDVSLGLKWLSLTKRQQEKQVKFATAVALTRTVQSAQKVVKRRVADLFVLRSKTFTLRGVSIQRAEAKDKVPMATLFGGPGYLTPHGSDLDKPLAPGASGIAVPFTGSPARPVFEKKIPKRLRPSNLGNLVDLDLERGTIPERVFGRTAKAAKGRVGRARRRGASKPFVLRSKRRGQDFIARTKPRAQQRPGKRLDFLYFIEPKPIDLPETYDFQDATDKQVRRSFTQALAEAYRRAIRTAR